MIKKQADIRESCYKNIVLHVCLQCNLCKMKPFCGAEAPGICSVCCSALSAAGESLWSSGSGCDARWPPPPPPHPPPPPPPGGRDGGGQSSTAAETHCGWFMSYFYNVSQEDTHTQVHYGCKHCIAAH